MFDLADVAILLLFGAACAWLWRGHGIRERALALVRQHCEQAEVILLDDNVALQRLSWRTDSRGQRRLARVYGFEFTVTGEQRHAGSISMFGQHLGKIELAAHPVSGKSFNADSVVESLTRKPHSWAPGSPSLASKPHMDESIIATYRATTAPPPATATRTSAEVVQLHDWRQTHPAATPKHPADAPIEQPAAPPPTRH